MKDLVILALAEKWEKEAKSILHGKRKKKVNVEIDKAVYAQKLLCARQLEDLVELFRKAHLEET